MLNQHLLSIVTLAPAAAAILLGLVPGRAVRLHRWLALVVSVAVFVLSCLLWTGFNPDFDDTTWNEDWSRVALTLVPALLSLLTRWVSRRGVLARLPVVGSVWSADASSITLAVKTLKKEGPWAANPSSQSLNSCGPMRTAPCVS